MTPPRAAPAVAPAPAAAALPSERVGGPGASAPPEPADRRRLPRHATSRPLVVVPVLPNGKPDWERRHQGVVLDASRTGVSVVLSLPGGLDVRELVLALPQADGSVRCAGLEVRRSEPLDGGRVRVGAEVGGFADQLFRPENLTPAYHPQSGGFALGLPEELLEAWAAVGLLKPCVVDRVQVCPRCRALPTYRQGCANCGSAAALTQDQLIHHFACAHVAPLGDFQKGDSLRCPKCRVRHLVINSDYEYLPGEHRCATCHWTGDERVQVAHCLGCQLRFPSDQAVEIDLKGYHADRLDALALAAAP